MATTAEQIRIAVIDLGTFAVRFGVFSVSAEFFARGKLNLADLTELYRDRKILRLGEAVFTSGTISESVAEFARAVFLDFAQLLDQQKVTDVFAVATCALRESKQGAELVAALGEIISAKIAIVTALEEAELCAKGVLFFEKQLPEDFLLLDIGGGSTEVSWCSKGAILFSKSWSYGAVRSQQQFLKSSPPFKNEDYDGITQLKGVLTLELQEDHELSAVVSLCNQDQSLPTIIGAGGTVRSLSRLFSGSAEREPSFSLAQLTALTAKLSFLTAEQIANLPSMKRSKADIILAGALIAQTFMECLGVETLLPSKYSLRHGLLVRELQRMVGG